MTGFFDEQIEQITKGEHKHHFKNPSPQPCIRGMRIRVPDVLEMLASGVSESQILADFPDLEREDIRACLPYAAQRSDIVRLAA